MTYGAIALRSYRVWVRSFDAAGNASQWSKPHDFKVASEPLKTPSISSPGSTTNDTTPTIRWQGSRNAVRTQVFVADVAAGRAVINQTVSGSSYRPPSALSVSRTYRVWVRSFDSAGNASQWSKPREFKVTAIPSSQFRTIVGWKPFSGAPRYDVQVYDITIGSKIADSSNLKFSAYQITSRLKEGHAYQVFARARNQDGSTGNWSKVREFRAIKQSSTTKTQIPIANGSNSGSPLNGSIRSALGKELYNRLYGSGGLLGDVTGGGQGVWTGHKGNKCSVAPLILTEVSSLPYEEINS